MAEETQETNTMDITIKSPWSCQKKYILLNIKESNTLERRPTIKYLKIAEVCWEASRSTECWDELNCTVKGYFFFFLPDFDDPAVEGFDCPEVGCFACPAVEVDDEVSCFFCLPGCLGINSATRSISCFPGKEWQYVSSNQTICTN